MMKRIYICHPFAADPEGNVASVRLICRAVIQEGNLPIAPHLYLPQFIDEQTERELAISACLELLISCDELRFYDHAGISAGMRIEIDEAETLSIPISRGER